MEKLINVFNNKIIGRYKNCRVLLLDDLFKGSITSSYTNTVFELLNFRYFNDLPFIVSSELCVRKLMEFDEAIGSRLV